MLGKDGASVQHIEPNKRLEGGIKLGGVCPNQDREKGKDAPFFGLDLTLEHHQPVVQLVRSGGLDKKRFAGNRAVLDYPLQLFGVIRFKGEDKATVAQRHNTVVDDGLYIGSLNKAKQARFELKATFAQLGAKPF